MRTLPARYDPERVEAESRAFWGARGLPRPGRPLGPATGSRVHLFLGALLPAEGTLPGVQRAVVADAEARYLAEAGRRPVGQLVVRPGRGNPAELAAALDRAAIWVGGGPPRTPLEVATADQIGSALQRLAAAGLLRSREAPMRACPGCRTPRTPETIVYAEEDGPAYVVRFPLEGEPPRTSVLVWTDAAWKLLGASAILIHPDLPYVRLRFRRRGTEEEILVLRSAMPRLSDWFEGCEMEVLEEGPGSAWAGRTYIHPFATEFPLLARLPAPAGTLVAAPEVIDSGTGAVPLVPAHGGSDHSVAQNTALAGWPVVALNGQLTNDVPGKYAGLPLESAEAFATRDLNDSGLLFAQLTVRRGMPHCSICGSLTIWFPGRAWCAEPGRLSTERLEMLRRLLPNDPLPPADDDVPWPVTDWTPTDDVQAPALSECGSCGRLGPPGPPSPCECGQTRRTLRRRLLPAFHEVLAQWAAESPFPPGEAVRLYVPDRRRVPATIHHLFGMEGSGASVGDIRATRIPTLPGPDLPASDPGDSTDGLRAALLRLAESPRGGEVGLADRRRQEERRLRKVWEIARDLTHRLARDRYAPDLGSIVSHLNELEEEDRAFLSLFERMRLDVIREYDLGEVGNAHDRLVGFLEDDLRDGYLPVVRPRLDVEGVPATKAAAYRLLVHVVTLWAELYAPIAPHTMEAVHRAFRGDSESLFDRRFAPIQEMVLDAKLEEAYRRWQSVSGALKRYRRELGLAPETVLPSVVLFVRDEAIADGMREARPVLARLARVARIEVASPDRPWDGKRVEARPVSSEIQRAYPAQAARIVRMLAGMNGRRVQEGLRSRSLEIALEGQSVQILPSMVELTEALPPGIVPVPWGLGELFVEVPEALAKGTEGHPPALTPDGFRLLGALRRRLRRAVAGSAVDRIVVAAKGPLREELEKHATALSAYFDGREFEVAPADDGFPPSETVFGRTRRGDAWSAWLPGLTVPVRAVAATSRPRRPRIRPVVELALEPELLEFLDDDVRAREATVHEIVEAFDRELGRPLVGPSKISAAWDVGLRSFEQFTHVPFEQLVPVPGFGPYVAGAIVEHFGGSVPPRPPRPEARDRYVRHAATLDDETRSSAMSSTEPEPAPWADEPPPSTVDIPDSAPPLPDVGGPALDLPAALDGRPREEEPVGEPDRGAVSPPSSPSSGVALREDETVDSGPSGGATEPPLDAGPTEPPEIRATDSPEDRLPPPPTEASSAGELPMGTPPGGEEPAGPPVEVDVTPPAEPPEGVGSDETPAAEPGDLSAPTSGYSAVEPSSVPGGSERAASEPPGHVINAPAVVPALNPTPASTETGSPEAKPLVSEDPIALGGSSSPADAPLGPDPALLDPAEPLREATPEPRDPVVSSWEPPPSASPVGPQDPALLGAEPAGGLPEPPTSVADPERDAAAPQSPDPVSPPPEASMPEPVEGDPHVEIPLPPSADEPPVSSAVADEPAPPIEDWSNLAPSDAIDAPAPEEGPSPADPQVVPPLAAPWAGPEGPAPVPAPEHGDTDVPAPLGDPRGGSALLPAPDVARTPGSTPPRVDEMESAARASDPAAELAVVGPSGPALPRGPAPGVELWPGGTPDAAWVAFLEATASGHRGVCLSREFPDRLRAYLGHRDVEVYWLSNVGRDNTVRPGDLPAISALFQRFLTERGATAIYLEGVEYLLRVHGPAKCLEFLNALDEVARSRDARVWIPLNPALSDTASHQQLIASFRVRTD